MEKKQYRGRFAPSPTGPLHFGSLIAAVGSFLQARSSKGLWYVRMEDLDPPREVPGAAALILRALEAYGLYWDGQVVYQSRRHEAYEQALERLLHDGFAYPCQCSRKQAAEAASALGLPPHIYPGSCRHRKQGARTRCAYRVAAESGPVGFVDALQGRFVQDLAAQVGDFIVRRADGLYAYQLAVVIDDAEQQINEVVRGSDLLDSTPRQIYLQRLLGLPTPGYVHLPVAVDARGQKLSKQTFAPALALDKPLFTLWRALDFLGQAPDKILLDGDTESLWAWAISNWRLDRVPRCLGLLLNEPGGPGRR